MINTDKLRHVSYLWEEQQAAQLNGDEVALLLYRSNLLGKDLRITNFGGGNTSCKVMMIDPLTGNPAEVMWIKGSGGDLASMKRSGLAGLYVERLRNMKRVYRGLHHEDEMVELFMHCLYDINSKAPSIDTPLHAFLPFSHIDHLHPDAAIAIAAAKDGKRITEELFEGEIGWVDWQRPGFDLGLQLAACLEENPGIKGIMLGSHGLFTWGDTSFDCYVNSLEVIEKCAAFIESHQGEDYLAFGGQKVDSVSEQERKLKAIQLMPVLRGLCSNAHQNGHPSMEVRGMIGHFTDSKNVLEFINSYDVERLAAMGTSCPDHFLRTKIAPLILPLEPDEDLSDSIGLINKLTASFDDYRAAYKAYYESCKHANSPAMRDPNPVVILYPGVGMFTFAADKSTARIASEFYLNAINVMRGSEAISSYTSLPKQEAFDIEYWLLEEAKLQRRPKPKPLNGRIALVTGSAGGIGKAIAKKYAEEGACVVLTDINSERLSITNQKFEKLFGIDVVRSIKTDVMSNEDIEASFAKACLEFGGCDIVVNNAGLSISTSLLEHSIEDWDLLFDVLVKGTFLASKTGALIMKKQGLGGDILNIVSKNGVMAGPNNAGYGSAKAAELHLSRLMAAELGDSGIRVNSINPDAVISDSYIWSGGWAEGRAKAYGISVEELPKFYAQRTLLKATIEPEDIANACYAFVSGLFNKSTGNTVNVDGGILAAFLR